MLDPFGSLSRLKQNVIGKVTHEDHAQLMNTMIRIYAGGKEAQQKQAMAFDLSAHDRKLIKFAELESVTLADLPQGASRFWSVGPTLSWPIFDTGRIRANIAVQDVKTAQQRRTYEPMALQALEEVENALVAYSREQVRRVKLADAVAANQQAVTLAHEIFRTGLGTFLNVLDSERALFASQSDLAQSEATISTDVVALYKALGGGWEILAPTPESPNTPAVASKEARGEHMSSGKQQ